MRETEGKCSGAHWEVDDRLSWLGDDRKATNPSMESGGHARGRQLVAAMWGSRGGVAPFLHKTVKARQNNEELAPSKDLKHAR